jgi:hypothetical protein
MSKFYVLKEELDKIAVGGSANVRIYRKYDGYNSIESYDTREAMRTSINLFENQGKTYKLHYKQVEIPKIEERKPHPVVKKNWDERLKTIKEAILQQEATLEKYVKEDLSRNRSNLFVESEYSNVVETKLNELGKHLASLRIELDKLKDHYENVGTNNETTS